MKHCDYIENSIEPCDTCPRLMSTLYRCDLLQETFKEAREDAKALAKKDATPKD